MLLREAQTDWLASKNIFYNTRTQLISDNMNDLIDTNHMRFHPEGLCNYLDYGYSVFGQTPVEEIRLLPPNTRVWINENKMLEMQTLSDPFESVLGNASAPEDVEEYFHVLLNKWVDASEKTVIVPTSGGFDSRFINCMIDKKECIHAYTYGISAKQEESMEVVYAKKLCEILKISWKQIELGDYNSLIDEWYGIFGACTHAHGMYHMEFYNEIQKIEKAPCRVLSGIYGDLWAGSWKFPEINQSADLIKLGITHGMNAESDYCKLKSGHELRDEFFEVNRSRLREQNWRIIIAARTKIVLLSYMLRMPEHYGFETWSPFLDFDAVSKMINLNWKEKERRKWQVDYFGKKKVLIGDLGLPCDKTNCLNQYACQRQTPRLLDVELMGTVVDENYVEEINRNLSFVHSDQLKYYCQYLVLYPIQKLLQIKEYGQVQ